MDKRKKNRDLKIDTSAQTSSFDHQEFNRLIAYHYDRLTRNEKRIADFLIQNQDEAAFMSAAEIARELGLSEPTIGRFARSVGFENFPAMSYRLQARVRDLLFHSARFRNALDDLRVDGDIYELVVTSEIDFLAESLHTLDRNAFRKAVELLRTHQSVFVYGVGPSVSLVDLLEIRLTRSARRVFPLKTYGREIVEPLLLMGGDDLLIAIAWRNTNPYLNLVLKVASEHKTPVIFITDTLGDMFGNQDMVVLAARRGPLSTFQSLTVPMAIINTLVLAMSAADQEKIMHNLDRLDQLRASVMPPDETSHSR